MKSIVALARGLQRIAGWKLWLHISGMVLVSLCSGLGTFLLIPILNMSGFMQVNTEIPLISHLSFALGGMPVALGMGVVLGIYIALAVAQNLLQRYVGIQNVKLMSDYGRKLRLQTFGALLGANWFFFLKKRKADLINSLTSELARVIHCSILVLQFVSTLVFILIQVVISFWFSIDITSFVLGCGIVMALFSQKYIRRAKQLGNDTTKLGQTYIAEITDQLNGMKEIKSNHLAAYRWNWYKNLTREMVNEQLNYIRMKTGSDFFYKTASALCIAAFIYLSVTFFQTRLDHLMIVVVIFARLWPSFTGLQSTLQQMASSISAVESVFRLQEECKLAEEDLRLNAVHMSAMEKGIECRNVYFSYENTVLGPYVLKHIHVYIPAYGLTAVVGRSGAGKSTLIDLLMGLLQPNHGEIYFDDKPLSDISIQSLRNMISYVPQNPYLFNGTIRENLLMAAPDATEEEIWEAIEFAAATDFVSKLPHGLDTVLGDQGMGLSGGERQRIVLARAILRKPSLLILDEATSALDMENESKIQKALENLKGRLTVIVIAHRMSTIRNADQIIVMDQGEVVQAGALTQLVKEKQLFEKNLLTMFSIKN